LPPGQHRLHRQRDPSAAPHDRDDVAVGPVRRLRSVVLHRAGRAGLARRARRTHGETAAAAPDRVERADVRRHAGPEPLRLLPEPESRAAHRLGLRRVADVGLVAGRGSRADTRRTRARRLDEPGRPRWWLQSAAVATLIVVVLVPSALLARPMATN